MIRLKSEDWRWATWREYTPIPRPEPRPFDQQALCERVAKSKSYWNWWGENVARLPRTITPQEAHFWLEALKLENRTRNTPKPSEHAKVLSKMEVTGQVSLGEFRAVIANTYNYYVSSEVVILLNALFSLEDVADTIITTQMSPNYTYYNNMLVQGFCEHLMPYLNADEREQVRSRIRPGLAAAISAIGQNWFYDPIIFLAAAVGGFSRQLETIIAALPDGYCAHQYHHAGTLDLILGFDDPDKVISEARRLSNSLVRLHHGIGWLAHTEARALDWIQTSIEHATQKDLAETLFRVLALVEEPEAIPVMLELSNGGKISGRAVKWLDQHRELAAHGAALTYLEGGKTSAKARDFLRMMKRKGQMAELQAACEALDAAQRPKFQADVLDYVDDTPPYFTADDTPEWLREEIAKLAVPATTGKTKKSKAAAATPNWLDYIELPPITLDGRAFNLEQGAAVLTALSQSTLAKIHPLITAVKTHIAAPVLDRFAWALFELWWERGANAQDKWAMTALGLLGSDGVALKLTPLIRKWPGERQHQRAVTALACLRAIGSDTALMQINSIAQKVQYSGIKHAAREAMEAIAKDRQMTSDQLEDRIVPDCGLNPDGRRTFDFGARKFSFVLDAELKPQIRDEAGKLKSDLPKPTQKDDAVLAEQAQLEWKLLKKQIREVAKVQSQRLESALTSRRNWSLAEFEALIVGQPVMANLARRLIWAGYDASGKTLLTFRVTDEKAYADQNDDIVTLEGLEKVGLIHPLHMTDDQRTAWGEVFADYEIIPPFPQLARRIYTLQPEEVDADAITRFAEIKIKPIVLIGVLQKLGWNRGDPQDAGVFHGHTKPFPVENVTAFIEYDGIPIGYYDGWSDQSIKRCYFLTGIHNTVGYHEYGRYSQKPLRLGDIDPVVMSEVLRDLIVVGSKGEA